MPLQDVVPDPAHDNDDEGDAEEVVVLPPQGTPEDLYVDLVRRQLLQPGHHEHQVAHEEDRLDGLGVAPQLVLDGLQLGQLTVLHPFHHCGSQTTCQLLCMFLDHTTA